MRKEKWDIDSFVHLIRRGVRGLPIVRGDSDKWRHLKTEQRRQAAITIVVKPANLQANWS